MPVRFEPIDVARDGETCVRFRRDSYFCSFGEGEAFDPATGGPAGYLGRLRARLAALPEGIVHVWRADTIVGQIEAQILPAGGTGYVNLFYLIPEERGGGLGDLLHDYVVSLFTRLGAPSARLSVSPANARALRYYAKHGWRDLGPRPDHPAVHLMELVIEPPVPRSSDSILEGSGAGHEIQTSSGHLVTLHIRVFQERDRAAVVDLWSEAFPEEPDHNVSTEMIDRKLLIQPELFLVAELDEVLVGAVMAGFDGVRGWMHRLAVRTSARRNGIGTGLVKSAEAALLALGCPKTNLQVRSSNAAVVAFYRTLGYSIEDRVSLGRRL